MSILRSAFLAGSESRWLRQHATRHKFVRSAVLRFMPGETVEAALEATRALGVGTVLTQLGENVSDLEQARGVARHYLDVLERVRQSGLERVRALSRWIWIDIESTAYTDRTLDMYRRMVAAYPRVGVCIQAYLYRTAEDLKTLLPLGAGLRLVKGAYREPPDKAFPKKSDVDENYFRLAQQLLSADARAKGVRAIFGTHDPILIGRIEELGRSSGLSPEDLEFQMLYGIRRQEQERLAKAGHKFRVLISYGDAWFPWYMRRLAERPANVLFVVKSLVAR
jgi:proline dehydrogenase